MRDADATLCDRYGTLIDSDEETLRIDAALDRMETQFVEMDACLDAIDGRLDRLTRRMSWWGVWVTLEVLVGVGLVAWW